MFAVSSSCCRVLLCSVFIHWSVQVSVRNSQTENSKKWICHSAYHPLPTNYHYFDPLNTRHLILWSQISDFISYIHHGFWGELERGRDSYQPSLFPTFPNPLRFQGAAQRPPPAEPGPIRFYPTMKLGHREPLKLMGICSIRTQKEMKVWPSNMDITCIWYVHIYICKGSRFKLPLARRLD